LRATFLASFMARLSRSLLSRVSFALAVFRFPLDAIYSTCTFAAAGPLAPLFRNL
jgi:hypothetical protein